LVDVEVIWVQENLKLVSLCPETRADTALHVPECCRQYDRRDCRYERNGANGAGRHQVSVTKHTVLPSFVFIGKSLRDV
jgi:hypothetical protein